MFPFYTPSCFIRPHVFREYKSETLGINEWRIVWGFTYSVISFDKFQITEAAIRVPRNQCSWKFRKSHRKAPLLESLCRFRQKKLQHRRFPVKFAKFWRTLFFTEHLRWLLYKLALIFEESGKSLGHTRFVILVLLIFTICLQKFFK